MNYKHFILSLLALLAGINASAYTFKVDGIYYKILSETDKSVSVTYKNVNNYGYHSDYTGDIVVPSTVTFAGTSYDVTRIGSYAFSYCSGMTSIKLPKSISEIDIYAFYNCTGLTSITIPDRVTSIGNHAFFGCSGLTSIEIPSGVESIGDYAFAHCKGLSTVTLGNVTAIGNYAFYGESNHNYNLKDVEIPSSVVSIGDYAFAYQDELQEITFHEGLKRIGMSAFTGCKRLSSITIPSSIEHIDLASFIGCESLTTINASTITPKYIESNIFSGTPWYNNQPDGLIYLGYALLGYKGTMSDNTELSIPEGTTCIAGGVFYGQSGLKSVTIPSSVKGIGRYAFSNTQLINATIPESITEVGINAFHNTPWYANQPDGIVYVGKVAYRHKGNMEENAALELRDGTTAIADTAFYNCSNLASISIPNSVKAIGKQAFSGCSSLTSITVPGVSVIKENTFENCSSLNEVNLQDGTKAIDNGAFSGCSSLTNINWSSTLETIGSSVFSGCNNLVSIDIPEGVTVCGRKAFSGCTSLTSVTLPSTLGSGLNGEEMFSYGANNLKELRIKSRKEIPNLMNIWRNVSSDFNILNFRYYVPHGLREEYMEHISWYDKILEMGDDEDIVQFADKEVERICIANYDANLSGTVDKAELGGVHNLDHYDTYKQVFRDNTVIASFDEFQYFTNCREIPAQFFYGCSSLTSITIPESVTSIGSQAFSGCSGLTSITIPNSVTSIDVSAFSNCSGLTSITISNSVTSIGSIAFSGCSGLTSVTIPNSVISIGSSAFSDCSSLTSVTIPNSVTSIGYDAFEGCTSLTSVTIPNSVTSIGNYAFSRCSGLTDVYCHAENVPTTDSYAFDSWYISSATLHVPAGSVEAYSTTAPWSSFGTIAPIYDEESSKPFPAGTYAKADLKRTFVEGWNTICLPFAVDDIEAVFGTGAKAYGFDDFAGGELKFSKVTTLTAGTPYVIYVPAEITELIAFENIVVEESNTTGSSIDKNGVCFRGTYAPVAAGEWMKNNSTDDIYGLTAYGAIRKAGADANMLGFRGYFDIPAGTEVKGFVFDDGATGIKTIDHSSLTIDHSVFNLAGQRLNKAQKGINIINGKKILK